MHLITDNIQRLIALCRKQNITGYPESSKRSPSASRVRALTTKASKVASALRARPKKRALTTKASKVASALRARPESEPSPPKQGK